MKQTRYRYTILKNTDGKYWLWFDEGGKFENGVYVPNMKPYHEIVTELALEEGSFIFTDELISIPESCQLRPLGEYSNNYVVKARLRDEKQRMPDMKMPRGKMPGRG